MELDEYLERVDGGEDYTLTQMHQNGDYTAVVEALEYGVVNGANVEIPKDDAEDIISSSLERKLKSGVEETIATLLEPQYDKGVDKASNVTGSKQHLKKKALRKEKLVQYSEGAIGLSGLATLAGAGMGSVHVTGASATAGLLSAGANSKWQGMRDEEMKKASEGLESAYGARKLEIV